MRKVTMILWLICAFFVSGSASWGQEQTVQPQVAKPGIKPYLWEHPGEKPYVVGGAKTREEMARKIQDKATFVQDLVRGLGLTAKVAEYIQDEFADVSSPNVTEYELKIDEIVQNMLFNNGEVVLSVRVMTDLPKFDGPGNAWVLTLPEEYGNRKIILPKICLNVCMDTYTVAIRKGEILPPIVPPETSKGVSANPPAAVVPMTPGIIQQDNRQDRRVGNQTINIYSQPTKKGWSTKKKIIVGLLIGGGAGGGILAWRLCREKVTVVNPSKTFVPGQSPAVAFQVSIPIFR